MKRFDKEKSFSPAQKNIAVPATTKVQYPSPNGKDDKVKTSQQLSKFEKIAILADLDHQLKGTQKGQSPKLTFDLESKKLTQRPDILTHLVAAMAVSGTKSIDFAQLLIEQVTRVSNAGSDLPNEALVNGALAALGSVVAQDGIEGMLAAQMVATHLLAMEFLSRAVHKDQSTDGVDRNVNRAAKFQRTFLAQLEALNRHRGKVQQKVTVEHVNIADGGQAIVGNFTRNTKDRGEG